VGKTVFTNGCFDILHPGHVDLLTRARSLGSRLVVGLNSDASVRAIKGPERPLLGQQERKEILLALRAVDEVVIFEELTPDKPHQEDQA
jgi:rfaE bifunctional protein nucleotidyltransferase chain/domain